MTSNSNSWDRYAPATTAQPDPILPTLAMPGTSTGVEPGTRVVPGEVIHRSVAQAPTQADGPARRRVENGVEVPRQATRVEVGRGGVIQFRDDAAPGRETVSEVTGDVFYSIDLNAVAQAIKDAQNNGGQPTDPGKRVFVGPEGDLRMGNGADNGERVSEVTTDTFFATYRDAMDASRLERESAFVHGNMPKNTIRASDGTYDGWGFTISNEFGDSYTLFMYYHPSFGVYRVALIEPRMEGTVDAHGAHLFPDGTLCLTENHIGSGYPDMQATFAKAALWTRGASCYRRGYGFQFNVGQD